MAQLVKIPLRKVVSDSQFVARVKKGVVALDGQRRVLYTGEIGLGTPVQLFSVIFDTGSADMWVASALGGIAKCRGASADTAKFMSSVSTSYVPDGTAVDIMYGSGPVSGFQGADRLLVGGLVVEHQTFAQAYDVRGLGNTFAGFDGILGLAFGSLSVMGAPTPLDNLVSQQGMAAQFAIYLGGGSTRGELVLGGMDPAHYTGDLAWVKLVPWSSGFWEIALDGVAVGGRGGGIVARASTTIVDSGTSLLVAPADAAAAIAAAVGARQIAQGQYVVELPTRAALAHLPDITIILGGKPYTLAAHDYLLPACDNDANCRSFLLGVFGSPLDDPLWILGDVFMRKYYTVFDGSTKRVGFALAAPQV